MNNSDMNYGSNSILQKKTQFAIIIIQNKAWPNVKVFKKDVIRIRELTLLVRFSKNEYHENNLEPLFPLILADTTI